MSTPNLTGINGPRQQGTHGRLRNVLTNIASKQNAYPSTVAYRPGSPLKVPAKAPAKLPTKPIAAGPQNPLAGDVNAMIQRLSAASRTPAVTLPTSMSSFVNQGQSQLMTLLTGLAAQAAALRSGNSGSGGSTDLGGGGSGNQPGSASTSRVVRIATNQIGDPYVWGAEGPGSFDCSGLADFVLNKAGIHVPRLTAAGYYGMSRHLNRDQLRPGDMVFFDYTGGGIGHMGIYAGNGMMIAASSSVDRVRRQAVDWSHYVGGGRIS